MRVLYNDCVFNDLDKKNGLELFEESDADSLEKWRREAGIMATPPGGNFPLQNDCRVSFSHPTVPLIFVLGK